MTPITLTDEFLKAPMARAVPGAYWDPELRAWVLDDEPDARGAVVACRLFPGIEHDYPVLAELRESIASDAAPHDFAGELGLHANAPRVKARLDCRHWTLSEDQDLVIGYAEAVLREHGGFYLATYRGWGKTLAAYCLVDALDAHSTLVVVPNSAKVDTWQREAEGFTDQDGNHMAGLVPWATLITLPQDPKGRAVALAQAQHLTETGEPFVLVVHWEALAVIAGKRAGKKGPLPGDGWKKLGITWDLVVMDEGHRLANAKSMQSRCAKTIPRTRAVLASGSFFQNKWEEAFSQLQFLFPDRYKSAWRDWNNRFLDYVENGYGRVCIGIKEDMAEEMRKELGVFMSYREREATADAREVYVDLLPEQARVYRELEDTCLAELEDGTLLKAKAGVAMMTRLRQVADGLGTVTKDGLGDSSKVTAAVAVVEEYAKQGDDFAIFVWYKPTAYALADALAEAGFPAWLITGDVPPKERTAVLARFRAGEGRVLIGTIPTIGESVNLQRANHVIRVNRAWNPALNRQVLDRVDRQGQTRPVTLTDIIARGTVDELAVLPNLANKEALRRAVLGGRL